MAQHDVDTVRLSVIAETTMVVSIQGHDGFEPAFLVTAEEGPPAAFGWRRDVRSRRGELLSTAVTLPAAGSYSITLRDERKSMPVEADRCFALDIYAAGPPPLQKLRYGWRGAVAQPVALFVPQREQEFVYVEVEHTAGEGALLASVFEDGAYARSFTIAPHDSARLLVRAHDASAKLLIEEATNTGTAPLHARVRILPYTLDLKNLVPASREVATGPSAAGSR